MNSLPSAQETIGVVYGSAKDAVVSSVERAKEVIYPSSDTLGTPAAPHGIPPSDSCPSGKVAYEDKTITGKLSENLENFQSSVSSLRRPSLEALLNLQNEGAPQPPHGTPPSDDNHLGTVADQDKTLITRVSDNLPSIRSYAPSISIPSIPSIPSWSECKQELFAFSQTFPQNFSDTVSQAQRKMGLPYYIAPGTIPPAPHGVPPSDNNRGRVAEIDKTVYVQLEENWDMLRSEFMNLWSQSKRKLGWNWLEPGRVPEPPHGIPPSNDNTCGVVDERDKTLTTQVDEAVCQFRDTAQGYVDKTVNNIQETSQIVTIKADQLMNQGVSLMGLSSSSGEGNTIPQPPHGIPPSEGIGAGIVAEEDKTIVQKAEDAWEQVKEVTKEKISETSEGINHFAVETSAVLTGGYL